MIRDSGINTKGQDRPAPIASSISIMKSIAAATAAKQLVTDSNQALHDLLAGSEVVQFAQACFVSGCTSAQLAFAYLKVSHCEKGFAVQLLFAQLLKGIGSLTVAVVRLLSISEAGINTAHIAKHLRGTQRVV